VRGTHGTTDIVTTVAEGGATALVALDARTGAVSWRLELHGARPDGESELHAYLSAGVRAASWPRFLPVLMGDLERQLVWIDLETGQRARTGTATPVLSSARIVRAGGRFYLQASPTASEAPAGDDPILAVLDGDRPAITAAVAVPDLWPVWPQHVAGGRVWVTQGAKGRGEHPRTWLVLDGESLAVVGAGNASKLTTWAVSDVRDRFAAALGLP
jgi:outer membrane protein assembly factor BamB